MKVAWRIEWALREQIDRDLRAMGICPGMKFNGEPVCVLPPGHELPHRNYGPEGDRPIVVRLGAVTPE